MKKIYSLFNMKKQLLLTFVCTLLLGVFTLNQSFAQAIWSDSFDYAAGSLLTANGWTAHSGEGTNSVAVSAGSLSYLNYEPSNVGNKAALPTTGEDVNHSFPSNITSGTVYAAFMVNVTEVKNSADYFVHFMGQNATTFAGKVWAKKSGESGFQLGITKQSSGDTIAVFGDAVLNYGTTHLVVIKYTIVSGATNDQAFLFINPVVGSPEPATPSATATPSVGADPSYLAGFALRQGGLTTAPNLSVDGIRVASTWAEAVKFQGTAPMVETPVISPNGGLVFTPQTVTITCTTPSSTIRYTLDGNDPTEASPQYTTALNITSTTTVKAKAWAAGLDPSYIATTTYTFPVEVPNIAAFKAANPATSSTVYKITGDVTFVYKTGRNFYIKDATAGLLIFDSQTPVITNSYNNGDLISGGVIGTCTVYNGTCELIPTADLAAGTSGVPVQPITITMANLLNNFAAYESQLVKLSNVTFDAGTFGTSSSGGNINIYQDDDQMVCRNHYNNITGYVTDPAKHFDVTGFVISYVTSSQNEQQIAPREVSDIQESSSVQLSGTVTISGSTVFGETLTATANLTSTPTIPDLGAITYQWMRGGNMVGTNSATYTLAQGDVGNKISVTVTAANCSGSVSSAETSVVSKATQTAPAAPTLASKTANSITLNEISGCEYRMDGGAWQTAPLFAGLQPETTYSFEARKAETATHLASDPGPAAQFKTEPVGVNENELNKIQVYSFRNSVCIKNESNIEVQSVKIFDMTGRLVYQNTNHVETVITLQVTTGIYHVVLQNRDGSKVTKVLITR